MDAGTAPAASPAVDALSLLLGLQQRAMRAVDAAELGFVIANETWHLLPYRQAAVFLADPLGRPVLRALTGLLPTEGETPFTLWLNRLARATAQAYPGNAPQRLAPGLFDAELQAGWQEWWPGHALFLPLAGRHGKPIGHVLIAREAPWSDSDIDTLTLLAGTWGYCAHALLGDRPALTERWRRLARHPRRWQLLAALIVLPCLPVRLSAVAPAEIIPLQAEAIAAPMEGVVQRFHVAPNQPVKQGQTLFSLDDTALRNRRAVAEKALAVTRADALAAQQKAFDSVQSKGDLATLLGRVREKEAELAYLDESLARTEVKAPLDGIVVYGDPNDWLGKPVVTGERIAQLAQPDDLGVLIWLPVGDAINLDPGAELRMHLQVAPLSSLSGTLVQTSYQASVSPDGIAAYRVRGKLAPGSDARIGLRGTAKIYGHWAPALYWVMRRPLGALRQWLGV